MQDFHYKEDTEKPFDFTPTANLALIFAKGLLTSKRALQKNQ
jgi:hypothetical protein